MFNRYKPASGIEILIVIVFCSAMLAGGLILSVIASGGTFGQRCKAAYDHPADVEECVTRLVKGGPVYERK